jgi:restriction system protein
MKNLGPEFAKWIAPLVAALKDLGGSAKPKEVSNWIAKSLNVPKETLEAVLPSGANRFHNQIQWARQYLAWEGIIDPSIKGRWQLTPSGIKAIIDDSIALQLVNKWNKENQASKKPDTKSQKQTKDEDVPPDEKDENFILRKAHSISPEGYERLCQKVLREIGMEDVEVTGASHDGGIDGLGFLRLNPLIRIKVAFQSKRVKSSIGRSIVGDFRNAVMGRAEKGIIFTTGWFTTEAQKEATRDGVIPIELVDGEAFVELMQRHKIGLHERIVYDIDHAFFELYK